MVIGVFARNNGIANSKYSILLVRCSDLAQVNRVRIFLASHSIKGLKGTSSYRDGFLGIFFGGQFDYVAHFNDQLPDVHEMYKVTNNESYVGLFDAKDILEADLYE